jgi:hypothetical protein
MPSTLLQVCCFNNHRSKLTLTVISLATGHFNKPWNFVFLCDVFSEVSPSVRLSDRTVFQECLHAFTCHSLHKTKAIYMA